MIPYKDQRSDAQRIIDGMTRNQRKLWRRAGKPLDSGSLKRLARTQHDGSVLYTGEIIPPAEATQ